MYSLRNVFYLIRTKNIKLQNVLKYVHHLNGMFIFTFYLNYVLKQRWLHCNYGPFG